GFAAFAGLADMQLLLAQQPGLLLRKLWCYLGVWLVFITAMPQLDRVFLQKSMECKLDDWITVDRSMMGVTSQAWYFLYMAWCITGLLLAYAVAVAVLAVASVLISFPTGPATLPSSVATFKPGLLKCWAAWLAIGMNAVASLFLHFACWGDQRPDAMCPEFFSRGPAFWREGLEGKPEIVLKWYELGGRLSAFAPCYAVFPLLGLCLANQTFPAWRSEMLQKMKSRTKGERLRSVGVYMVAAWAIIASIILPATTEEEDSMQMGLLWTSPMMVGYGCKWRRCGDEDSVAQRKQYFSQLDGFDDVTDAFEYPNEVRRLLQQPEEKMDDYTISEDPKPHFLPGKDSERAHLWSKSERYSISEDVRGSNRWKQLQQKRRMKHRMRERRSQRRNRNALKIPPDIRWTWDAFVEDARDLLLCFLAFYAVAFLMPSQPSIFSTSGSNSLATMLLYKAFERLSNPVHGYLTKLISAESFLLDVTFFAAIQLLLSLPWHRYSATGAQALYRFANRYSTPPDRSGGSLPGIEKDR
ncbi:hypothetical protein CYMTET_54313, partial [Cymbomonas tetramitiformis]